MSLLKLLSPREIPTRKTRWGRRVRFFYWLLVHLLPAYKRSAISDTINLGDTQIVHNVRDYWYEQQLQRFRINMTQPLEKQPLPCNMQRKYRRSRWFCWSESLVVFHGGHSYNIRRADSLAIETDMDGQLRMSTNWDLLMRSEFVANKITKREHEAPRKSTHRPPKEIVTPEPPKTDPEPALQATTTKYNGFEENNLF